MISIRVFPRVLRVISVFLAWRVDEIAAATPMAGTLRLLRPLLSRERPGARELARGARLREALTELGPIFVKAGQIMSTRRDLIPADIADELAMLQDQVPPFPGSEARAAVEQALKQPITELFAAFDETALASASIAQVHAVTLHDGSAAVVKVLRPNIRQRIDRDIALLRELGSLAQRWHPHADQIRPMDLVAEVEKMLENELDLQREGASASVLKRNFASGVDMVVPTVYWDLTSERVLTMERVYGVSCDDLAAIDAAGIDRKALAAKGVRVFYEQVFRDNFFHADAHPGNVWVDLTRQQEPRFIALDFGIVGSLSESDQYWLAQNFIALFERDYQRIAQLHVDAGWMPDTVNLVDLTAAVRTVCEPYFSRPLSQISLADMVVKLFQTARQYELSVQPQLILLQKTLLNIEGVGRLLDPEIDIWAVAEPVLRKILRQRYSLRAALKEVRRRAPEWLHEAPKLPGMIRNALDQASRSEERAMHELSVLERQAGHALHLQRLIIGCLLGTCLVLGAFLLWTLAPRVGPWPPIVSAVLGLIAFAVCWPRRP